MNAAQRLEVKTRIKNAAMYYGRQINMEVVEMYMHALNDFTYEQITEAMNIYARNPKNKQMFLAADLISIISPEPTVEDAAKLIASKITHAITKFGWCNAEAAKEYLGPVGWEIVTRKGGWTYICENHGLHLDPGTFEAQAREIAKVEIVRQGNPKFAEALIKLSEAKSIPNMLQEKKQTISERRNLLNEQAKNILEGGNSE